MTKKEKIRKIQDGGRYSLTIISTLLCVLILFSVIFYVFFNGSKNLSFDLITSDYKEELTVISVEAPTKEFTDPEIEGVSFSTRYGVGFKDSTTTEGKPCVLIGYIADGSTFNNALNANTAEAVTLKVGDRVNTFAGETASLTDSYNGWAVTTTTSSAEEVANILDDIVFLTPFQCLVGGGGIRGSILTTLLLILVTLIISLPLGIASSVYLVLYAKEGRVKHIIQTMIDMTSGIPSIIFGFVGAIIFIPFVETSFGASGFSVLAGALTMTIVLLPTIIKTTSEALLVIPQSYTSASLALGASTTQTIFKVIIPNAIPGILTSALLSIGRIIGESAALIFVIGTNISDSVSLTGQSTSLAVHIWSITSGENPNYETACSISIIILVVVLTLSIAVKLISKKINKMAV